jgi:dihydroorotase
MTDFKITLRKPDDFHVHLRDGEYLASVAKYTSKQFARAIVMPNLKPPITSVDQAQIYYQKIKESTDKSFEPLMTLYLTESTSIEELVKAKESGFVLACKYYPAGATTNSQAGVRDLKSIQQLLKKMEDLDLPLLVHGEVTDSKVDIFDREDVFIEAFLVDLCNSFPKLRIVLEHITTKKAVDFITKSKHPIAATITAHHLLVNRNAMFVGGIRPHYYCLPILKKEEDRVALLEAAVSGNPKFFLGTDSAPHPRHLKENDCGCAGSFTAPHALELYATAFDSNGKIKMLEQFASCNGADFYKINRNSENINLIKRSTTIPKELIFGNDTIVPFWAGETINWKIEN